MVVEKLLVFYVYWGTNAEEENIFKQQIYYKTIHLRTKEGLGCHNKEVFLTCLYDNILGMH